MHALNAWKTFNPIYSNSPLHSLDIPVLWTRVYIFPKYGIFAPPLFFKNDIFPPTTVEIFPFPRFFHLFPIIFALFLIKSSYVFPSHPILHNFVLVMDSEHFELDAIPDPQFEKADLAKAFSGEIKYAIFRCFLLLFRAIFCGSGQPKSAVPDR